MVTRGNPWPSSGLLAAPQRPSTAAGGAVGDRHPRWGPLGAAGGRWGPLGSTGWLLGAAKGHRWALWGAGGEVLQPLRALGVLGVLGGNWGALVAARAAGKLKGD